MMPAMKAPRVTDSSLRDGSHPLRHQFTRAQVRAVAQALDEAGVPVIEVTHGDGLAGSSIQYGFSRTSEMELIAEARAICRQARIAALLLPGVGTVHELKEAVANGMVYEGMLAERVGAAPAGTAEAVRRVVRKASLPDTLPSGVAADVVVIATRGDKKARGGRVEYALPARIGAMAGASRGWSMPVSEDLLREVLG